MARNVLYNGIDVSKHQGVINWEKAKKSIDFAILRCGFGGDYKSQDDIEFFNNVKACERLNIPYAVYLYSYANTEEKVDSEIKHALRLIGNYKPFCIYYDMEDATTEGLGKATLTAFAMRFCEAITKKGFKAGVYANQYWFQKFLDVAAISNAGYSIWCAKYSNNAPNIAGDYDIWQYSSTGRVDGISGNVDMNYMYNDVIKVVANSAITTNKKSIEEIADEVIAGKWGDKNSKPTREERLTAAGHNYNEVQAMVNKKLADAETITYTVKENDNLTKIAKEYNTTVEKIAADNDIKDVNKIYVDQKLIIKS